MCALSVQVAHAQGAPILQATADPSQILRVAPGPTLSPAPQAPDTGKRPTLSAPKQGSAAGADAKQASFLLKRVEVTPSALLSAQDLAEVWAPYLDKEVGINEVKLIVKGINDLYWRLGHYAAQASLPRQRIVGGVLKITLVEGRVERLSVEGQTPAVERLAENVFALTPGEVLQAPTLQERLARFNRGSDTRFFAALKPGEKPGSTEVIAQAELEPAFTLFGSVHNEASDAVGRNQMDVSAFVRRVFNGADRISVLAQKGDGVVNGLLMYSTPLNAVNTRLGLSLSSGDTRTPVPGLEELVVEGHSSVRSATLTHPLPAWRDIEVDVSAGIQRTDTRTALSGLKLGTSTTEQHTLGVQVVHKSPTSMLSLYAAGSEVRLNSPHGPLQDAYLAYASATWSRGLTDKWWLLLRSAGQVSAGGEVPAAAKFALGNPGDVRGYRSSEVFGDEGHYALLEVHRRVDDGADAFGFFDMGRVTNVSGPAQNLQSVGLGLSAKVGQQLSFNTSVAHPLTDASPDQKKLRVLARVTWQFF
jgi:hemolysin activation/secretion protein